MIFGTKFANILKTDRYFGKEGMKIYSTRLVTLLPKTTENRYMPDAISPLKARC